MTLRIGIFSFAHVHAEGYASVLQTMPDVEFIGIADENIERGQHFAARYGVNVYPSYEALLADNADAVVICSENARHLPLVRLAAEAGAHVLCEKPLATTIDDAREIVQVCADAGVLLMTAFPMRFSTPAVEVKKQIDSGVLGAIYGINATNQGSIPELHQKDQLPFLRRDWFVDKSLAGGGAVTDHVVHLADLLRWYLGKEAVEVYAATNQIIHENRVEVETAGLVMLTFEDGTFASIDCSWSKPAAYPTWGGLAMEIVAEDGMAKMDAFKQVMNVYRSGAPHGAYAYWGSDSNAAMLEEFTAAIREGRAPAVTGEDGLRAVEIVAAAYESAERGQPVKLSD